MHVRTFVSASACACVSLEKRPITGSGLVDVTIGEATKDTPSTHGGRFISGGGARRDRLGGLAPAHSGSLHSRFDPHSFSPSLPSSGALTVAKISRPLVCRLGKVRIFTTSAGIESAVVLQCHRDNRRHKRSRVPLVPGIVSLDSKDGRQQTTINNIALSNILYLAIKTPRHYQQTHRKWSHGAWSPRASLPKATVTNNR